MPIALSLLHRFRSAFADLHELKDAHESALIGEAIAAHMRSAQPMALLSSPDPKGEAEGHLSDGASYRVSAKTIEGETFVVLAVNDGDENVCLVMTPVQVIRMRADLDAVASGVVK